MSRRLAFITLGLGLACANVLPICSVSRAAEPPPIVRAGIVIPNSPSTTPIGMSAFRERLRELGYIEGQNLVLDRRWANDQTDRLPELVGRSGPLATRAGRLTPSARLSPWSRAHGSASASG